MYHRLDIRMWYSVKLVKLQFVVMADVDICAFIFGTVAVLRCREYFVIVSFDLTYCCKTDIDSPVMHLPSCSTS
jgi:hypothetical protein